ncbi:luciferase family protein [Kitasatospora sp. DSM 101779]|uniref:luciferase domain-containing protein n=1 Tax=Kitasatospora sp. DSM 101779 TaxID=2853165 RepID=UPI0021DB6226|nr:luciferase family protein [Kitasatospora sp. DSM 101779]MCU7821023.1 DUF5519 family protein [Kitasatospora sp. DSM 101779]
MSFLSILERFDAWTHLVCGAASCGGGVALSAGRCEIVHVHEGAGVDVHLTRWAIDRFAQELRQVGAVSVGAACAWVTVEVERPADADVLMTLVSLALHAHTGGGSARPSAPCTLRRGWRTAARGAVSARPHPVHECRAAGK